MDTRLAPPVNLPGTFGDGPVVWRRWRVAPDRSGAPLLTGLLGFPWRDRLLEARCAALDPSNSSGRYLGRFHRAVPALGCTCGIYASRSDLDASSLPRTRRGEPVVEGFVRLSGRVIEGTRDVRAERAEVIGPLVVRPGRPPWFGARASHRPVAVKTLRDEYRVGWKRGSALDHSILFGPLCRALAERYRCAVMAGRS